MSRDIDQIIERLTAGFPHIHVRRLPVPHLTDDGGLWLLALPDRGTQVQVGSGDGNGPFLIESDHGQSSFHVPNVSQAVSIIRTLLL
ncbi:MAG: hypothetical protein ABJF10_27490 [Chthoniobacter sp.]|uniref:hypothetical protein n=1 Tax=Chthoniobacter sp. TaxID=2510640 RepID=UPI0032A2552A